MSINERLEYLRAELRAERISYGELAELQGLTEYIDPSDVELLEAAGVPEWNLVWIVNDEKGDTLAEFATDDDARDWMDEQGSDTNYELAYVS